MKLSTATGRYLDHHRDNGSSKRTIETVNWRLAQLVKFAGNIPLKKVSKTTLINYFDSLIDSGLSDGSLAGHKSTVRAFFNWAKKRGFVKKNPAKVLSSKRFSFSYSPVKSRPAPSDAFQAVIDALPAFAAHRGYNRRDVRDALLVSLAVDSGCRKGELCNIRRADILHSITNEEGVYHVQSRGKTGAATVRFFEATASLCRLWLVMLPDDCVWLFSSLHTGERLRTGSLTKCLKRVCLFANVPAFGFQSIRKRNIVDAIQVSGDPKVAMLLAGHKDIRTTQRHYNHVEGTAVDDTAGLLAQRRHGDGVQLAKELFRGK